MNGYHHQHRHHHPAHPQPVLYGGLIGVFGGIIGLTTATLHGGARLVKTIVEDTLWGDCSHHGHYPCDPCCHHYTVECLPHTYGCDCCK